MQVVRVEARKLGEPGDIVDCQPTTFESDCTFFAELLQRTVGVHGGKTQSVRDNLLSEWQIELSMANQADDRKSSVQLTKEVRDALLGSASTDIHNPRP